MDEWHKLGIYFIKRQENGLLNISYTQVKYDG